MRTPVIASALLLSACAGFQPLHQATGSVGEAASLAPLQAIAIDAGYRDDSDDKRAAYLIRQALEERVGGAVAPLYTLKLTPRAQRAGLAVGTDDVASRYDYNLYTAYRLEDRKSGKVLTRGNIYSTASFGAPRDPYGRISAEVNAAEQAAAQAADDLILELALYLAGPGAE